MVLSQARFGLVDGCTVVSAHAENLLCPPSYPSSVIQHAVWLYLRFNLSQRDVEDLLAERGLDISDETVRRWVVKFGTAYAKTSRRRRTKSCDRWHLDEMFVSIGGRRMYLWRAVDAEGEVLDIPVQSRRQEADSETG